MTSVVILQSCQCRLFQFDQLTSILFLTAEQSNRKLSSFHYIVAVIIFDVIPSNTSSYENIKYPYSICNYTGIIFPKWNFEDKFIIIAVIIAIFTNIIPYLDDMCFRQSRKALLITVSRLLS